MTECRMCAFYFKRGEILDEGRKINIVGCVKELELDTCHEFVERWNGTKDNEFIDSLGEECMSLEEYREFLEYKDKMRINALRIMLKDMSSDKEDTP